MQTGDVIRDAQGRAFQIGPMLGRGLVGKTYLVRQEDSGAEFTLKCPLGREDFRDDTAASPDLIEACRDTMLETGRLLEDGLHTFLPPLYSRFTTADGIPVLVLPRYTTSLEERLSQGCSFAEVVETLIEVARHLVSLAGDWGPHGNLRPGNILLNDRGDVFLADPATDAVRRTRPRLSAISRGLNPYLPPESLAGAGVDPRSSVIDTYALGMILFRAVMTPPDADTRAPLALPERGLDKRDLVEIKARAEERMREEDANPRFHGRLADRVGAFLNRAISRETHPSPPYRFRRMDEALTRLEQISALIRPEVASVGKVILTRPPNNDVFEAGEDVAFTVGVSATSGVDDYEDISTGLAVFDSETRERLRNVPCSYTVERMPTGRFRFLFKVHDLEPARYVVRAAFAIRDSGQPPATAEASFEVRAPAGYVPPGLDPAPDAIPMEREAPTAITEVGPDPSLEPDSDRDSDSLPTEPDAVAPVDLAAARAAHAAEPAPIGAAPIGAAPIGAARAEPGAAPRPAPTPEPPRPAPTREPMMDPGTWMELPPPGMVDPDKLPDFLSPEPEQDDGDDFSDPGLVARLIDMVRGDSYLAIMTGFGLIILVLLLLLTLLSD